MSIGKNSIAGDALRGYVERIESIRAEKKQCTLNEAEVIAEAKANGFIPAAIKACVKIRTMKPHDRQEAETLLDMYLHALGMDAEPPLFRGIGLMSVDINARESVIEGLKKLVPATGDIIVRIGEPVRLWRDKDGTAHAEAYVDPASKPEAAPADKPGKKPRVPKPPPPDVDGDGAQELGRQAARENRPVIDNPFPFGDWRRAEFDAGWRKENGGDGMGPDEDD